MTLRLYNQYFECTDSWLDSRSVSQIDKDWLELVKYSHQLLALDSVEQYRNVRQLTDRLNTYLQNRQRETTDALIADLEGDLNCNVIPFRS